MAKGGFCHLRCDFMNRAKALPLQELVYETRQRIGLVYAYPMCTALVTAFETPEKKTVSAQLEPS